MRLILIIDFDAATMIQYFLCVYDLLRITGSSKTSFCTLGYLGIEPMTSREPQREHLVLSYFGLTIFNKNCYFL